MRSAARAKNVWGDTQAHTGSTLRLGGEMLGTMTVVPGRLTSRVTAGLTVTAPIGTVRLGRARL
jgi:hypothetical protein